MATQETKLDDTATPENYVAVNDTHVSTTDPDAALVKMRPTRNAFPITPCIGRRPG